MSRDRHQRITQIFRDACELDPANREAFVHRACDDPSLRAEVLELLAYDGARAHQGLSADTNVGRLIQKVLRDEGPARLEVQTGRVGPYQLRDRIGEGGMGQVYAADQQEPVKRRVALKLIKMGMDSAQVVARFEAERQTLAMMSHPNIAQVFDGGVTDEGRPFFAMEYVDGDPITEYCDQRELSTRARLDLFLDVLEGVQHAHQKGIIHRDLKPSNLLVTEYNGRPVPKVIDFGVARATAGTLAERTQYTMVGQMVGTLDYMSPEQADPTQLDVDTRADVFSLGVVLYQLVSGYLPIDHSSSADLPLSEIQRSIREQDAPTPSTRVRRQTGSSSTVAAHRGTDARSLIRQLTGDLDWIILKAMEKDPDRRYPSASAFADDLRRHLADEPVMASPPSALYRAQKWARRNRVYVTAGALIATAMVAGIVGVVSSLMAAQDRAADLQILANGYRMRGIVAEAELLWPPHPTTIPKIEALRDWVQDRVDEVDDHRRTLDERDWDLPLEEGLRSLMTELIDIERVKGGLLSDAEPTEAFGWSLEKRLQEARTLNAGFTEGGEYAKTWEETLPLINEAYPDLDRPLTAQMGLVPLGPDPDTDGLWVFAHLLTGSPAKRDPTTGKFTMTEETGLVLVLLPGGTFWMGAQRQDPKGENYDENLSGYRFDAMIEAPVHEVPVDPFFISKFEMTKAQWLRFVSPPSEDDGEVSDVGDETVPIGGLTMAECEMVMHRLGLAVPDEEEWEYAARAGTNTPWWTGRDESSLEGAANLFNPSTAADRPGLIITLASQSVPWEDNYVEFSPVGVFRPNPFGLYDIHGNAGEYCVSHQGDYRRPRVAERLNGFAVSRGGSSSSGSHGARCSYRSTNQNFHFRHRMAGLRPARHIDR